MRKVLQVSFQNEVSKDVGGISREFFTTIMREMFTEAFGLFRQANTEQFSYMIAEDSREIVDYEALFRFFGRLLGKALFDRVPLNVCLNQSVYLALLGKVGESDYDKITLKQFK